MKNINKIKSIIIATAILPMFVFASNGGMNHSNMKGMHHSNMKGMHHSNEKYKSGVPVEYFEGVKTIRLEANDMMRYSKQEITVKKNEPIRFIIKNVGMINHEFTIGTKDELKKHKEEMMSSPSMVHKSPNSVTVLPNGQQELIWKFTNDTEVGAGCLLPGHFEAGMFLTIKVI
jgi:uncharacterized cupredoxin-like copper-binding protein